MDNMNTQPQRLAYLVEAFKADSEGYQNLRTPIDTEERRAVLRSLMNIRAPKPLCDEARDIQDAYLKERAKEKGIVTIDMIPEIQDHISVWQGDITRLACDAIVNAANSEMLGCFVPMHNCIDNPMLN